MMNRTVAKKKNVSKEPEVVLEVDTLLQVKQAIGHKPELKYFSHFDEAGRCHCFTMGTTSYTCFYTDDTPETNAWNHWQIFDK